MDFLSHIPKTVENNSPLVSFDVTSLFMNIPNNKGPEAISVLMNKQGNQTDQRLSRSLYGKNYNSYFKTIFFAINTRYKLL